MKRFFIIFCFALTLMVLSSCGNKNEEDNDHTFAHINLNPYERLISASVNRYDYIDYLVELDYDPWTKILYRQSPIGKTVYVAVISEHRFTVHHDSKNIEWTDSAETVLINNNKQATAILKACNNKPSPEDKKKLDSIFAKGKKQIDYFKKCKDKIYPKTVKEWENRFIEETNPD